MNILTKPSMVLGVFLLSLLSSCTETNVRKVDDEPIFTSKSGGLNRYNEAETSIQGFISGRDIGVIGTINSQGELKMNLPESISDEMLDARPNTDIRGGGLSTVPDIRLWKSDADYLILVYVNREYEENGMTYHLGWNYATNNHQKVNSAKGYKWVIMDK